MEDILDVMGKKMESGGIVRLIHFYYWFIFIFFALSLVVCRGTIW